MNQRAGEGESLDELQAQHKRADLRLKELERHVSLSPDEQVEQAQLKKEKLRLKDAMRLRTQRP